MAVLLGLLLAIVCISVLVLPFVRANRLRPVTLALDPVEEVLVQREAIYEEIRILQLDHQLGRIGELEYQSRLQAYRSEAAYLLKLQESLETELGCVAQDLEGQILELRDPSGRHGGAGN